jgi:DNA repair protein RecN (Recombination protein N)
MLRTLHIENIAVIKCVDIAFDEGFTVLTGETGAGKSILIDSLGLLLGGKFSREIIRTGEQSASVSAVFDSLSEETVAALCDLGYPPDEEGNLLLRRVLHADGKSSLRLGGQPITATLAREIGRLLLNIHGQNDNQRLLQKSTHLHLLDAMGDYAKEKSAYAAAYERLCACERELAALGRSDAEKLRLSEMLTYQIKDIEAVKLKAGEIEGLERERERLKNIEKIEKHVKFAATVLDSREKSASVAYLLGRGSASLRQIADVIPEASGMAEQLDDMLYRVRDISCKRSLGQRLLGVGTVTVTSSDKSTPVLVLKNIKDPLKTKELIHNQVEEMKMQRRMRIGEIMGGDLSDDDSDLDDEFGK